MSSLRKQQMIIHSTWNFDHTCDDIIKRQAYQNDMGRCLKRLDFLDSNDKRDVEYGITTGKQ